MSTTKDRFVFRTGLSKDIPALVEGEGGFDLDTRTLRVGDGTSAPVKVLTDKTVGGFTYALVDYVEYPEIRVLPGGTVDGVQLSDIRSGFGLLAYATVENTEGVEEDRVVQRTLETDQRFLVIEHANGRLGNPKLSVSPEFLEVIAQLNRTGGYSYGTEPPQNTHPGHMFWSTIDEALYIRVAYNDDRRHDAWVDISTGGGGGGGGNATHISKTPPIDARVGDRFIDTDDWRVYLKSQDANGHVWREILT